MRVVFFGTPEFATASLEALASHPGVELAAVVTATDKRGGRGGGRLLESDVKRAALALGLPVLQPKTLRGSRFLTRLRALEADLFVVVAFRMLPRLVWDMPPLGTVNVHGSLLPAYRGAAPIHWAVINGETETGVTTFFLRHVIDTGDLLLQKRTPVGPDETTGEVYERLRHLGAEALRESVDLIAAGQTTGTPQDESRASHAPKVFRDDARVDWAASAKTCHDLIRGMSPFPGAWTEFDGREVKLLRSARTTARSGAPAGTPLRLATGARDGAAAGFGVSCGPDGEVLELLEVKPAGKRLMSGRDYANGLRDLPAAG